MPTEPKTTAPTVDQNHLLLSRLADEASGHRYERKFKTPSPNVRWASERLDLRGANGEVIWLTSVIDVYSNGIIGWTADMRGLTSDPLRDLMLMCVQGRFGPQLTRHAVDWRSDNERADPTHETVAFATSLGLVPCSVPFRCKGMVESIPSLVGSAEGSETIARRTRSQNENAVAARI